MTEWVIFLIMILEYRTRFYFNPKWSNDYTMQSNLKHILSRENGDEKERRKIIFRNLKMLE